MKILMWVVGIIFAFVVWSIYNGGKLEKSYQKIIQDLTSELLYNPRLFLNPIYASNNHVSQDIVFAFLMEEISKRAIESKVRSPFNYNLIPQDIMSLHGARADFEHLFNIAIHLAFTTHQTN